MAVDAAGTVYASNLGRGIQVVKSTDGGDTWSYVGNVVPPLPSNPSSFSADRNWMAAAAPGHLVVAWMGNGPNQPRAVGVNTTFDGGATWLGAQFVSRSIGWLGTPQFDPSGTHVFIPFTVGQPTAGGLPTPRTFELRVAGSDNGGISWDDVDTGVRIQASGTGGHWSGVHMAPALDVTGDGHVVYVWSEEVADSTGLTALGSRVRFVASPDLGATWGKPVTLSTAANAILPWVTGGAGDRFHVIYFGSAVPGDSDYVPGAWALWSALVDGAADGTPKRVETLIDPNVHLGNICTRGGGCQHPVSDRELLDFFESDLLPDGRIILTYPADDVRNGKAIEIRAAIQSGGTPLLLRPG